MEKSPKKKLNKQELAEEVEYWDNLDHVPKGWVNVDASEWPRRKEEGPCYYCGEKCEPFAGNPGKWPIMLCHSDEPGKTKPHHVECISARLRIFDRLMKDSGQTLLNIVNGSLRCCIEAHGDITPEWIGSASKRIDASIRAFFKNEFRLIEKDE